MPCCWCETQQCQSVDHHLVNGNDLCEIPNKIKILLTTLADEHFAKAGTILPGLNTEKGIMIVVLPFALGSHQNIET